MFDRAFRALKYWATVCGDSAYERGYRDALDDVTNALPARQGTVSMRKVSKVLESIGQKAKIRATVRWARRPGTSRVVG